MDIRGCEMITWMTNKSFAKTGHDLDNARLKLQMRQGVTIFDILTGVRENHPKADHPAVRMWTSYEFALGIYVMMLGMEWSFQRGFAENEEFWSAARGIREMKRYEDGFEYEPPPWMRDTAVLASHRSNLARRDGVTYGEKWKVCPPSLPYIWPVLTKGGGYVLKISKADKMRVRSGERKLPLEYAERVANWP